MPLQQASAQAQTQWGAWHLKIDFPETTGSSPQPRTPRIAYTLYRAVGATPTIQDWVQTDISKDCKVVGTLTYDQAGYAIFNGSSFIRCKLPPKPPGIVSCNAGAFWFAADVRLNGKKAVNPIFEGVTAPNHEFTFALPGDGVTSRTRLELPAGSYTTSQWSVNTAGGNRMMIGAHGPTMVGVTDYFETQGLDWLGFMDKWQDFFEPAVTGAKVGHLVQAPDATWLTGGAGLPWMHPEHVFIGYSPATGSYFEGALRNGEIDPPGCFGG
jgi:hypothetical protein